MALTYGNELASMVTDAAGPGLGGNELGSAPRLEHVVMELRARVNELEHRIYVLEDQIKQKGDADE